MAKHPPDPRFPGVEIETIPTARGMDARASFVVETGGRLQIDDIHAATIRRSNAGAAMFAHFCRKMSLAVMREAAVVVLKFAGRDWSRFWGISMGLWRPEGVGHVIRVDYRARYLRIQWDRGEEQAITMDEAIGLIERGEWQLERG